MGCAARGGQTVTETRLRRPLNAAISILDGLGIPYAIVGGLAVSAWGVLRSTRDVDLYAELGASVRPTVLEELSKHDFDVPAMEEELQKFGMSGRCFDRPAPRSRAARGSATRRSQRAAAATLIAVKRQFPPICLLTVVDGQGPVITGRSP